MRMLGVLENPPPGGRDALLQDWSLAEGSFTCAEGGSEGR